MTYFDIWALCIASAVEELSTVAIGTMQQDSSVYWNPLNQCVGCIQS